MTKRSPNIGSVLVLVKHPRACAWGVLQPGDGKPANDRHSPKGVLPEEAELWSGTRRLYAQLLAFLAAFAQRSCHVTTTRHIAERAEMRSLDAEPWWAHRAL
jgi:hypothetical protein